MRVVFVAVMMLEDRADPHSGRCLRVRLAKLDFDAHLVFLIMLRLLLLLLLLLFT